MVLENWTLSGSRSETPEKFRNVALGPPPTSCTMGTESFAGGKERPGRDADPSPLSNAFGHERVELSLYSSYRP